MTWYPTHIAARAAAVFTLGVGTMLALLPGPAGASFPGRNGRLAVASENACHAGILQTLNPDGSGLRTLVDPECDLGAVRDPQWSGDGSRLLFGYAERSEAGPAKFLGLATIDAEGKTLVKLPHETAYNTEAAWSPDGSRVAFTRIGKSDRYGGRTVIYTANADGSGERRIADGTEPRFSPDGRTLAYVGRRIVKDGRDQGAGIRLRDARTGSWIRRLTTSGIHPDWAPGGKRLLYVTEGTRGGRIAVIGRDGRGARLLVSKKTGFGEAVWSPDGKCIAYVRRYTTSSEAVVGYSVRVRRLRTGSEWRALKTAALDLEDGSPFADISWQPLRG